MKAKVQWVGDERFMGTSESGHVMVMDCDGGKTAPSPLESVLLSLGGCSSVDVVSILQKARQQVSGCAVELSSHRVDSVPRVFDKIHLNFIISGKDIAEKHVERAVGLSADKYCSVAMMLNAKVNITHSFEILET
jgi:putative redox protein